MLILLITALVHFCTVAYFVANPLPQSTSASTIKNIQEQFATIVLDREQENIELANSYVPEEPVIQQNEMDRAEERSQFVASNQPQTGKVTKDGTRAFTRKSTNDNVNADSAPEGSGSGTGSSYANRQELREQIDRQVANTGILAVLGSTSSNATSGAVQDILGSGSEASQDFDQAFKNIDRVASSGQAARGQGGGGGAGGSGTSRNAIVGERTTQGGRITTAVSGIGNTGTAELQRSSNNFIMADLAPLNSSGEIDMGAVIAGARDVDEVKAIVQAHTSAIDYCYQRERKRKPDLKGKVAVRFTILPNGKVQTPKIISSTLNSENVERCILSRISRWDDFGEIDPSLGNASFRQVYSFGF